MAEFTIPGRIMKMYKENGYTEDEAFVIEKKVYDHFPASKAERKCANEKAIMDSLRESKRKKLMHQSKRNEQTGVQ